MMMEGLFLLSLAGLTGISDFGAFMKPSLLSPPVITARDVKTLRQQNTASLGELTRLKNVLRILGGDQRYASIFLLAGREFHIDPLLLVSLASVESSFRTRVQSQRKARGLMQLSPTVMTVLGVTNPWDPYQNIMGGAAYLLHCFERYQKHPHSTHLALAAYNVGPAPAEKLLRSDAGRRFVKKVLRVYNRLTDIPIEMFSRMRNIDKSSTDRSAHPSVRQTGHQSRRRTIPPEREAQTATLEER